MDTVTVMRRLTILLLAGGSLAPLAACGSEPPPAPATTGPAPSAGTPVPSGPVPGPASSGSPAPTGTPGGPARTEATRPPAPPRGATTTPVPPPGPGEVPGGLPHGNRTITGVVDRSGDCTMLRVGDRRWGLTGAPAGTLTPGDRVTVTGQITTTGADCAGSDVVRTLIVQRVTPG